MRYVFFLATAFAVATAMPSRAAEPESETVEIPLEEIWAHEMPGTLNIHELEGKPDSERSLMAVIGRALNARQRREVGPAFAVPGTGLEALKGAFAIITEQPSWTLKPLRADGDITVAFFTTYSPWYVHLSQVTREGNTIRIEYEIIPHRTDNRTLHFALIPFGRLPSGDYVVEIVDKSLAQKYLDLGFKQIDDEAKELIVSSSFEFHVD